MNIKRSIESLVCITLITSSFSNLVYAEPTTLSTDFKTLITLATRNKTWLHREKNTGLRNVEPKSVEAPHPVEFQRKDNFFANGKVPKMFEKMQKQFPEWTHHQDEIVARVEQDKTRTDLLTLGIIDIGFDLGNPEIQKRAVFKTEKGKLTGAGFDYRGNDTWGSAVILDPWVYAIGAKGINSFGQIDEFIENPLEHLTMLNDVLVKQLMERIRANPKLNTTFFQKLNPDNTSIMGLLRLSQFQLDAALHENLNSQEMLIQPSTKPEVLAQNPELKFAHDFAKTAWVMDPNSGLPDFLSHIQVDSLAGLDILIQEIGALYTAENKAFLELMKNVGQTGEYLKKHHFNEGASRSDVMSYTFSKITEQLALKKIGFVMVDPVFPLLLNLRAKKVQNPKLSWAQVVDESLRVFRNVFKGLSQHPDSRLNFADQSEFVSGFESVDDVEKFMLERYKSYDLVAQLEALNKTGKVPSVKGVSSLMRKFGMRTAHPLLHPESIQADHATHIATTGIPYLGERYRAAGYAVNLGMTKAIAPIQNEMVEKNLRAMETWMRIPMVARAIHKKLTKDVGMDLSGLDVNKALDRKKLSRFLLTHFEPQFRADAARGGIVGQNLHWELADRIEKMNQDKLIFANLSLGGTGEQPELRPRQNTPGKKLGPNLDFIFTEFQKYTIADALVTKAPNTLFFMAAGNSNNFGDGGLIRSNYPADLRSKWLIDAAQPGDYLPAEKADNVVIVMSNNEKGNASNFTNVIFTKKVIFATRGEDIVAHTFTHNLTGVETTIQTEAPWLYNARNLLLSIPADDSRLEDLFESEEFKKLGITQADFISNRQLVLQALAAQIAHLKIQYNDFVRFMDGTSMASPGNAYIVMKQVAEHKMQPGVNEKEVFGKEGFRPADMIADMQKLGVWKKIGEPDDGNSIRYSDFQHMQRMLPDSNIKKELISKLGQIRKSSALCQKFYGIQ